jgi:protease IV
MTMRAGGWVGVAALLALLGCDGRPRATTGQTEAEDRRSGPFLAILDLSDGVPEQSASGWLGLSTRSVSLEDLAREADELAKDSELRGVLVRLGTARIGLGRSEEVGALLAALGEKHPVWCYADDYGNGTIALAARGCKRIWGSPAASVDAVGLAAQTLYFHKLLADQLGLQVDILQVGKFKGAEEPFTRDGPSPEARQSLESTLADMRASWLEGIGRARPNLAPSAVEDGPYAADEAKTRGLVDDVGYFDEARDAMQKATGAVRSEVRMGSGAKSSTENDLADALRTVLGESPTSAPIVVVRAIGAISMDSGGGLGGGDGIVERHLIGTLIHLERDDEVKAVVVRIDSPGGSALASDLLWHALMRIRAKKTLVVSVGDMAASGGYYLASTGSVIFADEASIVGSIGVVGGKIAADHALERIGVHAETFPANAADPHAGPRAAYESLLTPWDDATRERVRATMTGIYQLFLSRVAEGRGIAVERVAASAEGRIFSGREGKARGLVDRIGGLREAIAHARMVAGLPADARVGVAGEPTGLLGAALGDDTPRSAVSAVPAAETFFRTFPDLAPFVASLVPLAQRESAICALPFALTIR